MFSTIAFKKEVLKSKKCFTENCFIKVDLFFSIIRSYFEQILKYRWIKFLLVIVDRTTVGYQEDPQTLS